MIVALMYNFPSLSKKLITYDFLEFDFHISLPHLGYFS